VILGTAEETVAAVADFKLEEALPGLGLDLVLVAQGAAGGSGGGQHRERRRGERVREAMERWGL